MKKTPSALAQTLQRAMQAHSQGQLDTARHLYQAVLSHAPTHFDALHHLGMVETQTGHVTQAVALFERAVRVDPRLPDVHNNLAWALQTVGRTQEALASYERALRIRPDDTEVLNNLGLLLKKMNRHEDALRVFDRALDGAQRFVDVLTNRGNTLLALGRPAQALESFDEALRLSPANPVILNNRSIALVDLMRFGEAVADASAAIAGREGYADAYLNRGNALRALGRDDEARADFEQVIRLRPDDPRAHTSLAGLLIAGRGPLAPRLAASRQALEVTLTREFGRARDEPGAPFGPEGQGISRFRLRHELGQAHHLAAAGIRVEGLETFLAQAPLVLARTAGEPDLAKLTLGAAEQAALVPYLASVQLEPLPELAHCLNPALDWARIERDYLGGRPELQVIDDFLAPEALAAFQRFNLRSRVWLEEYQNQYLGAFGHKGFATPLHLQLARELRAALPQVMREHALNQLWGFKYDAQLTAGINVHADFAEVNLNFWTTPDAHNLDPATGGLKVWDVPAPRDWSFHRYNREPDEIHAFLQRSGATCVRVPYRCNRAVLFNSALFHETDELHFDDSYEGRRVNMTYLFGRQLSS